MIPEKVNVKEVESTVTGDVIGMSIDDASMEHIMMLLTDLYSDPELAVLREYSTNALDAQREVGVTRPIEISLPNTLSPFLLIRDFGVGLSVDDIHNIYSKYGASTKRGTNDQVGMLGLGCKSGLTYADQFTVTSVQNGTRVQVVVSRNASGAASMTVVETSATDAESGTTIMIPAKRYNDFPRKAKHFFRFWEPGSVLVDGEPPVALEEGLKVTDDIRISTDVDKSYIIMGNVAYPWQRPDNPTYEVEHNLGHGHHLVARVPIGAVTFPPSRESLMYEDQVTNPTLTGILKTFKEKVPDALVKCIEAAPTMKDALQLRIKWHNVTARLGLTPKYTYKGIPMPDAIESGYVEEKVEWKDINGRTERRVTPSTGRRFIVSSMQSNKLAAHQMLDSVRLQEVPSALWVEDYDRPSFTAGQKKKLKKLYAEKLCEEVGGIDTVVFIRSTLSAENRRWVDPKRIIKWERIAEVRLPVANRSGSTGKIPGSFDFYTKDGFKHNVPGDDLGKRAASYPIYWINGNTHTGRAFWQALLSDGKDFSLVCLPANRVEKFKRTFPKAREVHDVIRGRWTAWWKTVGATEREALALSQNYNMREGYARMDASKVDDPDIVRVIKAAKMDTGTLGTILAGFHTLIPEARDVVYRMKTSDPLEPYPLINVSHFYDRYTSSDTSNDKAPLYRYLNTEYAFRSGRSFVKFAK